MRELASRADVSPGLISQIENGRSNPSVDTIWRIATALSLEIGYFFPTRAADKDAVADTVAIAELMIGGPGNTRHPIDYSYDGKSDAIEGEEGAQCSPLVHSSDRPVVELSGGVTWSRLTQDVEPDHEFLEIIYEPGATSGATKYRHTGREFGLVLEGTLLLDLGSERYVMQPGDSIIFDSTIPHRLGNGGESLVRAIWVVINR